MSDFSHLFLVINSSVNIIIYGWKDKKFRELLLKLFKLECFVKSNTASVVKNAKEKELNMTQLTIVDTRKTSATLCEVELEESDGNMINDSIL